MRQLFLLLLTLFTWLSLSADRIKIACVGNSITYGARIANREQNSYPAQLQYILGDDYLVRNFGHSGRTLLSTTDKPYIKEAAYRESLDFEPDIVIIKLGTNDSKASNGDKLSGFRVDYKKLIDSYLALPSHPRIILCLPLYCYHKQGEYRDSNTTYQRLINPAIEQLAYDNRIETVDLFHLFSDRYKSYLMPDSLHPSSVGAGKIAQRLSSVILRKFATDFKLDIPRDRPFNFHGYCGYLLDDNCRVVSPVYAAKGHPWVLRGSIVGEHPESDVALLEQGFHIVYGDISDATSTIGAVDGYDILYDRMVARGLSPKVVVKSIGSEALSLYSWAIQSPDRVASICAMAPFEGDSIQVSQLQETAERIVGIHKIWSEAEPSFSVERVVNFVLRHTGLYTNPAIVPVPGNEYRASVGFKDNNEWHGVAQEIADSLTYNRVDVLLLGNSITMGFVGSRQLISGKGKGAFDRYFDSWECAGIAGDHTQHLLWRVQNHRYERSQPKAVVITIGVNNLASGDSPEETAEGVLAVVSEVENRFRNSRIILFGLLPCFRSPEHELRIKHDRVHQILAQTPFSSRVEYVDARATFLEADGSLKQELYSPDQLHLSLLGYKEWSRLIDRIIHR